MSYLNTAGFGWLMTTVNERSSSVRSRPVNVGPAPCTKIPLALSNFHCPVTFHLIVDFLPFSMTMGSGATRIPLPHPNGTITVAVHPGVQLDLSVDL